MPGTFLPIPVPRWLRGPAWLEEEAAVGRKSSLIWSPVSADSRVQWMPQPQSPHLRRQPSLAVFQIPCTEGLREAGPRKGRGPKRVSRTKAIYSETVSEPQLSPRKREQQPVVSQSSPCTECFFLFCFYLLFFFKKKR